VFIPIGFIVYYVFPIPLLNILLGIATGAIGFAFAFLPINDRPMDVWIINFIKSLTSPTQYFYHKNNEPLYFIKNLYFVTDPHRVIAHVEAQEKLASYLSAKTPAVSGNQKKQAVHNLLGAKQETIQPTQATMQQINPQPQPVSATGPLPRTVAKSPFLTGVIKNHKLIPIPGVLVYVKDEKGSVLRLLKSNPHGVFATFNPLPSAEYSFEVKDPNNSYIFDTMKIKIDPQNQKPLEIYSKELL